MTQIVSFYSPKTAGASSVSLNAAILQKAFNPSFKVTFVEVSGWSTQASQLQASPVQTWDKLKPFLGTNEWNKTLLERLKFNLGADIYWSPTKNKMPEFQATFANQWRNLLTEHYDLIVVDIANGAPEKWQDFWFKYSQKIVGVVTPDPTGFAAFKQWRSSISSETEVGLVLNQVPSRERKRLLKKFEPQERFWGALRSDESRFWRQCYQHQPVALQGRSGFKKDLISLLPTLFTV